MPVDAHANFAYSTVATAPSPATSGTSLTVASGEGVRFPVVPFNATVWPVGVIPLSTNAEIVRVTARATDVLTITRAQESSSARTVIVGDQIAATVTAKTLTDVETDISGLSSVYQPLDSDLTTLAGLTATTNNFIVSVGSAWASRTPAQVKTTLAIANTDVSGLGTMSTQNANAVAITAGTITGLTSVLGATVITASGAVTGQVFVPSGLTGTVSQTRYVGATASGAPASGTFALGDFVVDYTGAFYICTASGSPGTWIRIAPIGVDSIWDAKGDIIAGTAADTAARLAVGANNLPLIADSAQSTGLKWAVGGLPIAGGGTGQVTATEAFDALAPTTARGDLIYRGASDNLALPKSATAGQFLVQGVNDPAWGNAVDVQVFTGSGTWTAVANAQTVVVLMIGAAGGGGSGRRGASLSIRCGGGGGGGAPGVIAVFQAADLGASQTVTIGAGGTGNAARTVNDTSGQAGGTGGTTSFGAFISLVGGTGGNGGTATAGAGGAASVAVGSVLFGGTHTGGAGASASTTGLVGNAGSNGAGLGGGGGGSGGGLTTGDVASNGGAGGTSARMGANGTNAGGAGGAGVGGTSVRQGSWEAGSGAAGGASVATGSAANAGGAATVGNGGGGGGASLNGFNSGAGSNGGPGYCVVVTFR